MTPKHFFALFILSFLIASGCATGVTEVSTPESDSSDSLSTAAEPVIKPGKDGRTGGSERPADKSVKGGSRGMASTPAEPEPEASREEEARVSESAETLGAESAPRIPAKKKHRPRKKPSSGLTAGVSDDNKQFNYFLNFLNKYRHATHLPLNIEERIRINIRDLDGKSIPNAEVRIHAGKRLLEQGKTYADGTYMFFPSATGSNHKKFKARISHRQVNEEIAFHRDKHRNIEIILNLHRGIYTNIPVDILFVLDTTGSMGEEIHRLKKTIEIINLNIASLSVQPRVRFGMVLYRDQEDSYLTKVIPLTGDLDDFTRQLNKVKAGGGGDTPEDLQTALRDSMKKIEWNKGGIKIGFIITDAPPHLDYGQAYTYIDASRDAKKEGIKLFTIGTGGLNLDGEYVLRQIAQYTYGKYIFLTYGEKGESEGGRTGSVSHHTGANYQVDKLEAVIIRIAKEEISHLTDQPLSESENYFQAMKIDRESSEDTLKKLFNRAMAQLVDYSTIAIPRKTPAVVTPISVKKQGLRVDSELFTEQLQFSFTRNGSFKPIERADLQKILKETNLQMTGLVDEQTAAKTGKMLGAKMIITGRMIEKSDMYIVFLKLIHVETAEILSITKLKIHKNLGTMG